MNNHQHVFKLSQVESNEITKVNAFLADCQISSKTGSTLQIDSRILQKDDVFVGYPITVQIDSRQYLAQAALVCKALLYDHSRDQDQDNNADFAQNIPASIQSNPNALGVKTLGKLIGHIAHDFYHQPSSNLVTIGVTGTNGKTSCSQWIAQALTMLGNPCGSIGTLGVGLFGQEEYTGFTTPQAPDVHKHLARLIDQGAQSVAMEVSSHALSQGRVNGVEFDIALFTNLTRDHLDYHGTFESYQDAKAQLFAWPTLKTVVINTDDAVGVTYLLMAIKRNPALNVFTYGLQDLSLDVQNQMPSNLHTHLKPDYIQYQGQTTQYDICIQGQTHKMASQLVGQFNLLNQLALLGVLLAMNYSPEDIAPLLPSITSAPGRMQLVPSQINQPMVVVDFAHTPDALEKVLIALKDVAQQRQGKLICVFGCGGDRDAGKRPIMGKIAQELADHVIITSDNPRTENPVTIIQDIQSGLNNDQVTSSNPRLEPIRSNAINQAIQSANPEDVVVIAGKGHEDYQEINGVREHFSDLECAIKCLGVRE